MTNIIEIHNLIDLFQLKVLIKHLRRSRQVQVAREEKVFQKSLFGLPVVIDYILAKAALGYAHDNVLS